MRWPPFRLGSASGIVSGEMSHHHRRGAADPLSRVRGIKKGADPRILERVIAKSIAISSGKGGVGKTITTCNLAIYYARKGLRVGLVDLDPLSDVASLLDIHESEIAVERPADSPGGAGAKDVGANGAAKNNGKLDAHLLPVFRCLDILFPFQKLSTEEVEGMMVKLYKTFLPELDARFDLLLFDMPAGMSFDDNLAYLPFMKRLILVTNPEPTAHASAGAYAKEVQRLYPSTEILVWHNRFAAGLKDGFNPSDVAGNYNRFVEEQDRLTAQESAMLRDFAFVPEDPAMDLLKGEANPAVHVLKAMRDCLDHLHGRLLAHAARRLTLPGAVKDLAAFYLHRHPHIGKPAEAVEAMGSYLEDILAAVRRRDALASGSAPAPDGGRAEAFSPPQKKELEEFLRRIKASPLRREILRLEEILSERIKREEDSRRAFSAALPGAEDKTVDREVGRFLVELNASAGENALMRSHGALLLFHFSMYKLFQSKTLVRLLLGLVPRKKNRQGRMVRDRFRQIRILVEGDPQYRERYLKTLRTLYVVVKRQLQTVADALGLPRLLLRDAESKLDGRAYLKLITSFLHETLYSGLSVVVGFDFRSAASAFINGAEKLLATLPLAVKRAS